MTNKASNQIFKQNILFILFLLLPLNIFFSSTICFSVESNLQSGHEIIASVNGRPIFKSELDMAVEYEMNFFKANNQGKNLTSSEISRIVRKTKEELVTQELLKIEAEKLGITVSSTELESELKKIIDLFPEDKSFYQFLKNTRIDITTYKKILEKQLLGKKVIQRLAGSENKITETMMRDYYQKNLKRFQIPETKDLQHLTLLYKDDFTVADKNEAMEIMVKIVHDAETGEDLYELKNKYQTSRFQIVVNTLHEIERKKLLQELDTELFRLQEKEFSSIIQNQTGLHVLRCIKIHPEHLKSYESSVNEIGERLRYIIFGNIEKQVLQDLQAKADIKIYE
ncbi:MAG: hypothetical protein A2161_03405 [Candidatus Schekmanbacteria bacterium RBG_13_48_7]|uniref:peptidylprolyl isomerase n=1 Tax=Candidatus Schekmanbacteria bacterium RBG_13_48_7 TaxID=1817878 RepID=A0A1F7S7Q3_9BACT|nr:MAG: hypothetical protein A2161_03405 [Candidatus Schekmanbacteria bacterium RBG_13_48_7]